MAHRSGVVIQLSPKLESCHRALVTVQKVLAPQGIRDVVIVSSREVPKQRQKEYRDIHIRYQVTPDGLPDYENIPFHMVHNIPPDLQCTDAKNLKLYLERRVDKTNATKHHQQQRHGLIPQVNFSSGGFSPVYIFWCLIFMLDWWRNVFGNFTFHTGQFWCSYEVLHGFKRSIEAPHYSPWISCCGYWAKGDRTSLMTAPRGGVMTGPASDFYGWSYFTYTMYRRRLLSSQEAGKRLWMLIFLVYWAIVSVAWWHPISSWIFRTFVNRLSIPEQADMITNPFGGFQIGLKLAIALFHGIVLHRYVIWNHPVWHVLVPLLMPLFMPFLGFLLVIVNLLQRFPQYEEDLQMFEDENFEKE